MDQNINGHKSLGFMAIFFIFLRLGLTSFGGPVAHLGFFRAEFIVKRKWLSEQSYLDIVSLCQFLPGPASSQVGMVLGYSQKGYYGALAAWLGFTLPSAIALTILAYALNGHNRWISPDVIHGLKLVSVAVVAQAVWGMAKALCTDVARITIMTFATCLMLLFSSYSLVQIGVIAAAGLIGGFYFSPKQVSHHENLPIHISHKAGAIWIGLFFLLLFLLPLLHEQFPNESLAVFSAFYRAGSLVFGGGHVVLPLLQAEVVPTGWVNSEAFLAGYGLTQAMPGPLFTFAAFLGASMTGNLTGWIGALICLLAIFLPSFLLVAGALPFWESLRRNVRIQAALIGINASVVGILLAALYQPIWTSAVQSAQDFAIGLIAFVALMYWRTPPWLVVIFSGLLYWFISFLVGTST